MKQKKKQFLVIGLGRFGASVARTLCELGHEVLAIDDDEDAVEALSWNPWTPGPMTLPSCPSGRTCGPPS